MYGALAYGLWGAFPLYWTLLEPAGALEILAHRIIWSALTMGVLVVLLRRTPHVRALVRDRRTLAILAVAAVTISINWLVFIWGVNNGRVVETSLGYFINPLVTVLVGVIVLSERLRRPQWIAFAVAGFGVVVLTIDYGRLPWVALLLAASFGTYGLAKKQADAGAVDTLRTDSGELVFRKCSDSHHHHLVCRGCGYTVEVEGPAVERWATETGADHGFTEVEHTVELFGRCVECSADPDEPGHAADS